MKKAGIVIPISRAKLNKMLGKCDDGVPEPADIDSTGLDAWRDMVEDVFAGELDNALAMDSKKFSFYITIDIEKLDVHCWCERVK